MMVYFNGSVPISDEECSYTFSLVDKLGTPTNDGSGLLIARKAGDEPNVSLFLFYLSLLITRVSSLKPCFVLEFEQS